MGDRVRGFLEEANISVEPLDRREVWDRLAAWRARFTNDVFEQTGHRVYLGYGWHAFSYGFSPAREGVHQVGDGLQGFLVLSADSRQDFGFSCFGRIPDFRPQPWDVIVTPTDLRWTLVFTHEPHCGPFFVADDAS